MTERFSNLLLKSLACIVMVCFLITNVAGIKANKSKQSILQNDTLIAHSTANKALAFDSYINHFYTNCDLQASGLSLCVFQKSMIGYFNLANQYAVNPNKNIITIIDFTKESTLKRMWIIDLKTQKLLLNSLVAHGQGSGDNIPNQFSNIAESHQSSLGFYVTDEVYFGKHGLSLKLEGLDDGINSLAKTRAIVVHGASYVSENFVKSHGRLGRSHGCPAVPEELNNQIINLIKNKTMLYINGSNQFASKHLNQQIANNMVLSTKKPI